jgi:hypothetical protein
MRLFLSLDQSLLWCMFQWERLCGGRTLNLPHEPDATGDVRKSVRVVDMPCRNDQGHSFF